MQHKEATVVEMARIQFQPSGREITSRDGETVLAAALRKGLVLPYSCRSGSCGVCHARLIAGKIVPGGAASVEVLGASAWARDAILLCQAAARSSELVIEAKEVEALAGTEFCTLPARVLRLEPLSHFVSRPDPRLRWVPDEVRQAWDAFPHRHDPEGSRGRMAAIEEIKRVIPVFYRAGVSIIVGTDAPWPYLIPGFSFHDELVILHRAGLTPAQVLTAATREASLRLGVDHLTGTLEEGKAADLLIAAGNPLSEIEDIRRVREVFRGGQRVDVARLEPGEFHPGDPVNASLLEYAEGISRPK